MTDKDKPTDASTDASKVELTDEQMDDAQGGAGYLKLGDIKGESLDARGGATGIRKIGDVQGESQDKVRKSDALAHFNKMEIHITK